MMQQVRTALGPQPLTPQTEKGESPMSENRQVLENEKLLVEITPAGAELTRICDKKNGQEMLWEGDPAVWGRHSPILFPFVGKSYENQYHLDGAVYSIGQHGFARDMVFELVSETETEVWYGLSDTEETRKKYPYAFRLEVGYRLEDTAIHVMWRVKNPGAEQMYFMIGAHPAFRTPAGCTIYDYTFDFHRGGKLHFQSPDDDGYRDPSMDGELDAGEGQVPLVRGFFDHTPTYIFDGGQLEAVSLLAAGKPYVTVECKGFPYMAVWTVEKTHPFVCLEPWYGRCAEKGFEGDLKEREGVQALPAGEEFSAEYVIRVDAAL